MKPNASNAIAILDAVRQQLGPGYLAYWVLPNVILTLSGARAFCDGVFWDDAKKGLLEKWSEEIAKSAAIIIHNTRIVWSELGVKEAYGNQYAGYELILEGGLHYMLTQTKLVKDVTLERLKGQASPEGFLKVLMEDLRSQARFKNYSKENLNHIAFGIFLGYPDTAIKSAADWGEEKGVFGEPVIDADIRGGDYYICPQPIYSYSRRLACEPSIVAHEQTWSTILKDYYTSDFHKSLEADKAFRQKIEEVGLLPSS